MVGKPAVGNRALKICMLAGYEERKVINMKKMICFMITVAMLLSSVSVAYAKNHNYYGDYGKGNYKWDDDDRHNKHEHKERKQKFNLKGTNFIKYGNYKLPIKPVTNGMGANVSYDDKKAIITVTKGSTTIVIDLKNKTVSVNGVIDYNSDIFKAKNSKKMTVLIKYIAYIFGIEVDIDDDDIIVEVPGLEQPTNIVLVPVGSTYNSNSLNSTTLYLTAYATIKAGQATGGRAELYIGNKLVAVDNTISATDTTVTFSTADNDPTNAELQALVPTGGLVTVRLYNAETKYVESSKGNPTLIVDYIAPSLTGVASAVYNTQGNRLDITVTGAGAVGDKVDVTKLSLTDTATGKTYQLTNADKTGSNGSVSSSANLMINIGSNDRLGLTGFGGSTVYLSVAAGSLITDAAGNASPYFSSYQLIPVTIIQGLDLPTNVKVFPVGTSVVENTINTTTLYLTASASITPGQATGGKAELYVNNKLVATDSYIASTDNSVTFVTGDSTPTNAELQTLITSGGKVSVRLYNVYNRFVDSAVGNPTLTVDYSAPTLTGINSAFYDVKNNQLTLFVSGAGAKDDMVDVTLLYLFDTSLGRSYQLTNTAKTGSVGKVGGSDSIIITIGSTDKAGLSNFGGTTVYLTVGAGSLIKDAAGNTSPVYSAQTSIPVYVIR